MEGPQQHKSFFDRRPPEPEYDFKSAPLPPAEQMALNELRKRLIAGHELTPSELAIYKSLFEKEKAAKEGSEKLTSEEEKEFAQLSKEQTSGQNWSPEKARRIRELYGKKMD